MRAAGTTQPYDESELGIGAADQAPQFAPLSERLEENAFARCSLFLLEILGALCLAALAGLALGMLMAVINHR